MRKKAIISLCLAAIFVSMFAFSGCEAIKGITNKVPEAYTEGVKYDRDFPDDVFEIYDGAVVFDSKKIFDEIVLSFGTEDDFDDVVDFYKEFLEENGINPSEENEDKDEYYVHGFFEGYEFKLQAEEASGEYVEDLFECVVYLSIKEADAESLMRPDAPTATPAPTAGATAAPTTAPTATAPPADSGETPLTYLSPGAWEMAALYVDGQYLNAEATMFFGYDGSGAFYYYDYESDERGFYYFSYDAGNGTLNLYSDQGDSSFQAYYDDGILHLTEDAGTDMYLVNWSENYGVSFSDNVFTAYGDWIYYEPETGYLETIAFWPDGSGYIYNWGGSGENHYMYWDFANGDFTIYDDLGEEYTYGIAHRGEVFELLQPNGSVFFYNRVSDNYWLTGYFYLDETSDDTVDDWSISLYSDGACDYNLNGTEYQSYWYIDNATGKLVIGIGEYDYYFDYHYDLEGLHLWYPEGPYYYHFLQVG